MVECDCTRDEEIIIGLTREYVRAFDELASNHTCMPIADGVTVYYTHWRGWLYVLLVDTWTRTISLARVECERMRTLSCCESDIIADIGEVLFPENLYKEQGYAGEVASILARHLCQGE